MGTNRLNTDEAAWIEKLERHYGLELSGVDFFLHGIISWEEFLKENWDVISAWREEYVEVPKREELRRRQVAFRLSQYNAGQSERSRRSPPKTGYWEDQFIALSAEGFVPEEEVDFIRYRGE